MNNFVVPNVFRFVLLVFLQVLVLKNIVPEHWDYFEASVFIYPVFIMLLPIRTPHGLLIFLGFLIGIVIDIFYDSLGVHASASVFTAFIRPFVLGGMEPREGYKVNQSPTKKQFGGSWFAIYAGILLLVHLFFYFSVEAFTFVYIGTIFLRTVYSFFISMIFVIAYQFIFNPEK